MIEKLKCLWIKYKTKGRSAGGLVPIVAAVKYKAGMDAQPIKEMLLRKMEKELINYVYYEMEEQETGVVLMKARIDVLRRDSITYE